MAPKSSWLEPKVLVPSVVAVAAVVALVVVLAFGGSSGDSASSSAPSQSSTTTVAGAPTTAATGGVDDGGQGTSVPTPTTIAPGPYTTPTMPVRVDVPPVDGAIDGEAVTVHASPEPGSLLYGVEARLCRGDAAITDEGTFTPTLGGVCIDKPLSVNSDSKVLVAGSEPFTGIDLTFRVGVGTTTFATQYSGPTSITCGPGTPCQIVLKLQYPKGFGFKGIPVTYR